MRVLLDTHAVLWYFHEPDLLSPAAKAAIESAENQCLISAATFWEIAIKAGLDKLKLAEPLPVIRDEFVQRGVVVLNIDADACMSVQHLPHHHRDPFDRLLAAQALSEDLTLISRDAIFDQYGVNRLW